MNINELLSYLSYHQAILDNAGYNGYGNYNSDSESEERYYNPLFGNAYEEIFSDEYSGNYI